MSFSKNIVYDNFTKEKRSPSPKEKRSPSPKEKRSSSFSLPIVTRHHNNGIYQGYIYQNKKEKIGAYYFDDGHFYFGKKAIIIL